MTSRDTHDICEWYKEQATGLSGDAKELIEIMLGVTKWHAELQIAFWKEFSRS